MQIPRITIRFKYITCIVKYNEWIGYPMNRQICRVHRNPDLWSQRWIIYHWKWTQRISCISYRPIETCDTTWRIEEIHFPKAHPWLHWSGVMTASSRGWYDLELCGDATQAEDTIVAFEFNSVLRGVSANRESWMQMLRKMDESVPVSCVA